MGTKFRANAVFASAADFEEILTAENTEYAEAD
jgi:hypothetical protein